MNETVQRMINESGKCLPFTIPGIYTLIYITKDNNVLCSECATKEPESIESVRTYDEGPTIYCEECNTELESSYGDTDSSSD